MPSAVALLNPDGSAVELPVELGEYEIAAGDAGEGEIKKMFLVNVGDTALRDISLHLTGPGADVVALAVDRDGRPGVWASPGEPILPIDPALLPGDRVAFYARAIFAPDDAEQLFTFFLTIKATSLGT